MPLISLVGIDEAIANLDFHPGTLKSQLIRIIRSSFADEESLRDIDAIAPEGIIRQLWDVEQPEAIRAKKKNLSSLKSTINKDLKELARQGKNPEGLIINRDNVFSISDEQKDDLLEKIGSISITDTQELLTGFRTLLERVRQESHQQETAAVLLREFDQFREQISRMAGMAEKAQPPLSPGAPPADTPLPYGEETTGGVTMKSGAPSSFAEIASHEQRAAGVGQEPSGGPPGTGLGPGEGRDGIGAEGIGRKEAGITLSGLPDGGESAGLSNPGVEGLTAAGRDEASSNLPGVTDRQSADESGFDGHEPESIQQAQTPTIAQALPEVELLDGEPADDEQVEIVDGVLVEAESEVDDVPFGEEQTGTDPQTLDESETELLEEEPRTHEQPDAGEDVLVEAENVLDESLLEAEPEVIAEMPLPDDATEVIDRQNVLNDVTDASAPLSDEKAAALTSQGKSGLEKADLPDADPLDLAGAAEGLSADGKESGGPGAGIVTQEPDQQEHTGIVEQGLSGEETEPSNEAPVIEEQPESVEEVLVEDEKTDFGDQEAAFREAAETIGPPLTNDDQPTLVEDALATEETGEEVEVIDEVPTSGGQPELVEEVLVEEASEVLDEESTLVGESETGGEAIAGEEAGNIDWQDAVTGGTDAIGQGQDAGLSLAGEGEAGSQTSGQRLALSHYIEPEEALAAPADTLVEAHDEYITQILERFMPKFIRIPAGYYPTGRDRPVANERRAQQILLQNFYISQLPVTNDLFDFFVRENGYETDAERAGYGMVYTGRISNRIDPQTGRCIVSISRGAYSRRVQGANWRHPQGPDSSLENKANHPVVQVSRNDALAFAAWAGKRLPSEDEWEAAARGPQGFLFPWGNNWQGELANLESTLIGDTTPVTRHGQPSMSPFGVYDLLGNVFEWTSTLARPDRPATGSKAPLIYVLKGGCWTSRTGITAAARLLEGDTWSNIIGFRCAV